MATTIIKSNEVYKKLDDSRLKYTYDIKTAEDKVNKKITTEEFGVEKIIDKNNLVDQINNITSQRDEMIALAQEQVTNLQEIKAREIAEAEIYIAKADKYGLKTDDEIV